jgi:dTDP-4-amino-4,6-dideoxygalactose transaminase
MIPFNKPYLTGKEIHYMYDAVHTGKLSGNGKYTQKCQKWFEETYGFGKCLLTTSCTDALEMAAILIDIQPGDEVILPSYTFVSTANAFVLRGAKLIFVDSRQDHPGIDESMIEALITPKTKAIVPVHYAGVACDMDIIMNIANRYGLFVVEDAAQSIDSFYTGKDGVQRALGSIGHLSAFSFHETKNIISGEGGMLAINDMQFAMRAEIIWEKGTNRSSFFRGEVDKYGWVDIGSSFLPSELIAAFLWAQLESVKAIQQRRLNIWEQFHQLLLDWTRNINISLPVIPNYAFNNAHMFYLVCSSEGQRTRLMGHLKNNDILGVSHYLSLNKSLFFTKNYFGVSGDYSNSDRYTNCLLRLPMFYELSDKEILRIVSVLQNIK